MIKSSVSNLQTPHHSLESSRIGIIGLGYVGLPLAIEFGKKYPVIGFDINQVRMEELIGGIDSAREYSHEALVSSRQLTFSVDIQQLSACNVYIVTVPTPVDHSNRPDLTSLIKTSETVGKVISRGDVVIYESTVYPGATEEDCIPVVEQISGLKFNEDFFAGYSPERISPGDKIHRLTNIVKITAGSTPETADFVDSLYRSILEVETHKAPNIKVAEAAKVIENTQRDVNIALVNELAMIFSKMGIDTIDVLEAAGSKWNFLPFRPGLVGGHCIGVDPYYLSFKAQQAGYYPELISAQRRINDRMGQFVVDEVVKLMLKKKITVRGARVLVLGIAFKENCHDLRNTRVVDIIRAFEEYGSEVTVCDPWADEEEVFKKCNLVLSNPVKQPSASRFDAVVFAVAHDEFREMSEEDIKGLCADKSVVFDVKNILPRNLADARL